MIRLVRRRYKPVLAGLVVVLFAVLLAHYVNGPDAASISLPKSSDPTLPHGFPHPPASSTGHKSGAKAAPAAHRGPSLAGQLVPELPQSTSIYGASVPRHSVVLTVRSDSAILQVGYQVSGGNPSRYRASNVRSPMRVMTEGRGYGLMAALGAQASPDATFITCTVAVDGRVTATRTVHGGWSVAVCVG